MAPNQGCCTSYMVLIGELVCEKHLSIRKGSLAADAKFG